MKKFGLILMFLLCSIAQAGPPIFTSSITDAEKIAKDLKLNVLTIVSADWCGYCKKLDKTISDNLDIFNDIVILKIDFDQNQSFVKKNHITKIPTLLYDNKKYIGVYDIKELQKILE